MKKLGVFLVNIFLLLTFINPVFAIYDPLSVENNKFGIHIIDENDLQNAASLVNSSGGKWGYVTIVITQNDRSIEKWQSIFDRMSDLKLIPLVRLATYPEGDTWAAPKPEDSETWAIFLNNLYWPVKNRYVILYNEPNHAKEWGNRVSPAEYANILETYSKSFKNYSPDFYILPAGLDASAPNSPETMDETDFIIKMINYNNSIFDYIDGWTSHSYPNPGFTGMASSDGKGSIRTYQWELSFLNSLGVNKKYPVFITETGWPHMEGISNDKRYLDQNRISEMLKYTIDYIWSDKKIAAVTPFVLNYQSYPFANFSWQKPGKDKFYTQFEVYKSFPKIAGKPLFDIADTKPLYNSLYGRMSSDDQITKIKNNYQNNLLTLSSFLFRFISVNI